MDILDYLLIIGFGVRTFIKITSGQMIIIEGSLSPELMLTKLLVKKTTIINKEMYKGQCGLKMKPPAAFTNPGESVLMTLKHKPIRPLLISNL